jgi:hypothetical protein
MHIIHVHINTKHGNFAFLTANMHEKTIKLGSYQLVFPFNRCAYHAFDLMNFPPSSTIDLAQGERAIHAS